MISVAVRDATAHGRPPIVTMLADQSSPSTVMCSKPKPLTVRSVPPPAEPASGVMAVTMIMDSNVRLPVTMASPKAGTRTCTECVPGGALGTTHVRFVVPPPLATTVTELQGCPPIAISGVASPLSGLSITRVTMVLAWPDVGDIAWTTGAVTYVKAGIVAVVRALPSCGV